MVQEDINTTNFLKLTEIITNQRQELIITVLETRCGVTIPRLKNCFFFNFRKYFLYLGICPYIDFYSKF